MEQNTEPQQALMVFNDSNEAHMDTNVKTAVNSITCYYRYSITYYYQ